MALGSLPSVPKGWELWPQLYPGDGGLLPSEGCLCWSPEGLAGLPAPGCSWSTVPTVRDTQILQPACWNGLVPSRGFYSLLFP